MCPASTVEPHQSPASADTRPADTQEGADDQTVAVAARPLVFVIDDEAAICRALSAALEGRGFKPQVFHTAKTALAGLDGGHPVFMLLNVALSQSDAVDVVHGLAARHYAGIVHMMTGGNPGLLEAVQRIGKSKGINFGAPLHKPFRLQDVRALCEGYRAAG
jgi:DNA-binding NtrC family response regulator